MDSLLGRYEYQEDKFESVESMILELILKHIKDLIYIMRVEPDNMFRYVFLNDMAKGHAKLENDCIGKTLYDVLPLDTADHLQNQYNSVLVQKKPVSFEDKVILADNRVVYGESLLSPIFDKNGDIRFIVSITRDVTESVNEKNMIKYIAFHDQLTGLPNRSSFKKELELIIKEAEQEQKNFALMYFDLDRFKFLNDTMGHIEGDRLLREIANRLAEFKKENLLIFRQGGDEFTVILKNTSRLKAKYYAERILRKIQQPFLFDNEEFFITASIGISLYPNDGFDDETLIKNADTALYRAKELGKSQFQFYTKDMEKQNAYMLSLERGLHKAIERNELELYFQPQIDLKTGLTKSLEALLRWKHSKLGYISPADFIPLSEENGLIFKIGEWVITTACNKLREWQDKGYNIVPVAINLSTKQFQQSDLVSIIKSSLYHNQIDPIYLELEITEGAMEDAKKASITLKKLKEIGVRIAIDDFGTGYSSLSHLKNFPIDTLKIDKSFVSDVLNNEKDAAITTTIIHLALSLGLVVIAEGVEQKEQIKLIQKMGCQMAQGYYFSKPLHEIDLINNYLSKKSKLKIQV